MSDAWQRGFQAGWEAYQMYADERSGRLGAVPYYRTDTAAFEESATAGFYPKAKRKRKRRKSPKQKLLEDMTNKKWKTYKGKKTWIQIRAQVSRSQAYKKKARRLK
jgi:hypothetical protein